MNTVLRTPAELVAEPTARRRAFEKLPPNWFAAVMGTGVLATAAATLPEQFPGLRGAATAVWALAGALLVTLSVGTAVHWTRFRSMAVRHHRDPIVAHFYGAPPMAMLTVGAGTLLLGRDLIGLSTAVTLDWVLWIAGTVTGLLTAVVIPYRQFTRHDAGRPFGGWLMPVVPPMVSASSGALLIPHIAPGQARLTLLYGCYAMFGVSLLASMLIISLIWGRLAGGDVGPSHLVPTLWIVLGPLGQSVTAANLLGGAAATTLPPPYGAALQAFGVVYGVPVIGFAVVWTAVAAAITLRTAREHLPFTLTWWSFTFPLGTCVTGFSGLAAHTGADLFRVGAGIGYAFLVLAWLVVGVRTGRYLRGAA